MFIDGRDGQSQADQREGSVFQHQRRSSSKFKLEAFLENSERKENGKEKEGGQHQEFGERGEANFVLHEEMVAHGRSSFVGSGRILLMCDRSTVEKKDDMTHNQTDDSGKQKTKDTRLGSYIKIYFAPLSKVKMVVECNHGNN
mmetsp:Transcript_31768/g.72955  ORF Transcript_31768/g.72955 Transcript_31768/m.72955 type:complete len:143 (-) Transcript_31768:1408-1836(-)